MFNRVLVVVLFANVMVSHAALLQDFCVANQNPTTSCKDPKQVRPEDFHFSGLNKAGDTSNFVGSSVTPVSVAQIPGLNTLGVSLVRLDFAPDGVIPPHAHPRASEILLLLEGSLMVGFVTSNPENRLITKTLCAGDVFVFPQGLVHFQYNPSGHGDAVAISGLSNESPGVISVANTVFGSRPSISKTILEKAFQVDTKTINLVQAQFAV